MLTVKTISSYNKSNTKQQESEYSPWLLKTRHFLFSSTAHSLKMVWVYWQQHTVGLKIFFGFWKKYFHIYFHIYRFRIKLTGKLSYSPLEELLRKNNPVHRIPPLHFNIFQPICCDPRGKLQYIPIYNLSQADSAEAGPVFHLTYKNIYAKPLQVFISVLHHRRLHTS